MKYVAKEELLKIILKEKNALQHQLAQSRSDIDYIAMMTEIEISKEDDNE